MKYDIFLNPPSDFSPTVEVASCYCVMEDKILFLQRHLNRAQGGTWGLPAGKLEKGERAREACIREVYEEVGLRIDDDVTGLKQIGKLYVRLPHVDFIYHMFHKWFASMPEIDLALDEHVEARWLTIPEAYQLRLVAGEKAALAYYERWSHSKRNESSET